MHHAKNRAFNDVINTIGKIICHECANRGEGGEGEGGGGGKEKQWSIRWLSCAATPSTVLFLPLFWNMAAFYLEEFSSLKIGLGRGGGGGRSSWAASTDTWMHTVDLNLRYNNSTPLPFVLLACFAFVHHLRNSLLWLFVPSQIFIANYPLSTF